MRGPAPLAAIAAIHPGVYPPKAYRYIEVAVSLPANRHIPYKAMMSVGSLSSVALITPRLYYRQVGTD